MKTDRTTCSHETGIDAAVAVSEHSVDFARRLSARRSVELPLRRPSNASHSEEGPGRWMESLSPALIEQALLIRRIEETLLELFSQGRLNGTVHTCIGQEFSAVAFAHALSSDDVVCSNHRCHGHYVALTDDCDGLIAELMGKSTGPCGGLGGSQHLCTGRFFSNGIQGGMVPVAAGMALAKKLRNENAIVTIFIGDGTLGEGIVYETLNIASKWSLPLLIVCENNHYAQSTPQHLSLAGDIMARAGAFGIETFNASTSDPAKLIDVARRCVEHVRENCRPVFCCVDTWRLAPHSKGDDHRDPEVLARHAAADPLNQFQQNHSDSCESMVSRVNGRIQKALSRANAAPEMTLADYVEHPPAAKTPTQWSPAESIDTRQASRINDFFARTMQQDPSVLLIGEDVLSPYGGAFKVASGLSDSFPDRVLSTPISEAAITGLANGLALSGFRPYVEIMFGDFVTLAIDQIINHASKFHHMYNRQVACPVVIRTPMGGHRGYGPTHSQTLDKVLLGIVNVTVIALNRLIDPGRVYRAIHRNERHPVIVIENKTDYTRRIADVQITGYVCEQSSGDYPVARVRPVSSKPTLTVVAYGGAADIVLRSIDPLFDELDFKVELLVPTRIHPLDIEAILESVRITGRLLTVEEGSSFAGWGAEVVAAMSEAADKPFSARRIAARPLPIPAVTAIEDEILPGVEDILAAARQLQ